jgi:hypothetical protein
MLFSILFDTNSTFYFVRILARQVWEIMAWKKQKTESF